MFSINTEGLQFPEDPCSFLQFKIVILKVKGNRRFVVIGASCEAPITFDLELSNWNSWIPIVFVLVLKIMVLPVALRV